MRSRVPLVILKWCRVYSNNSTSVNIKVKSAGNPLRRPTNKIARAHLIHYTRTMRAKLLCKTGELAGCEYQIDNTATIGKGHTNDIQLNPTTISREHARIYFDKDAGSFFSSVWKSPAGKVGGKERTLNDIEHEILRKMNEPRIHVAIVCASISCPDIRLESYTGDKLGDQLDDQMKMFLSSREKGMRLDEKKNRVYRLATEISSARSA